MRVQVLVMSSLSSLSIDTLCCLKMPMRTDSHMKVNQDRLTMHLPDAQETCSFGCYLY